ncbi:MAG: outer membrane protein assembly factor BamA [Alphaproteobacteria bacterium]
MRYFSQFFRVFFIFSYVGCFASFGYAGMVQKIQVEGNVRVDKQTVLSHLTFKQGEDVGPERLDAALKTLFATGLFADVVFQVRGNTLWIKVVENRMINQVAFEGNDKVTDEIFKEEIKIKPREVYTPARVQEAAQKIREIYRLKGRFAAKVEPKIIEKDQNRVDLIFEIEEGPSTGVRRIAFVGNHRFSDSRLESVILTKESRWYRFFTNDDTYDPDRIAYDKELLRRYYLANGYPDFQVISAVTELSSDRQDFYITFTLDEGKPYHFGQIKVDSALSRVKQKLPELLKNVSFSAGNLFNNREIERSVQLFTKILSEAGFVFLDVKPEVIPNKQTQLVDVTFQIVEAPKVYVNRIHIEGNTGTDDDVIRREFRFAEGDPISQAKLKRSQERLENLDFFEKVEIDQEETAVPDRQNMRVKVQDKSTGQLMFGGGYSTSDGVLGEVRFKERNFLGKGQELRSNVFLAKRRREFLIGFTEPYFLDRRLAAGFDVYRTSTKQDTKKTMSGGYSQRATGLALHTGYEISESLGQSWTYRIQSERIGGIDPASSSYVRALEGSFTLSSLEHVLFYDKRDSSVFPTEGYYASMANTFAGLGGNIRYLNTTFSAGYFIPLDHDHEWICNPRIKYGLLTPLGKKIRLSDRFFLGGGSFPGFAESGIGPRDMITGDALGGRKLFTATVDVTFPLGLPKELDIRGLAFTEWGSVWDSGETDPPPLPAPAPPPIPNNFNLRGSVGVGLIWRSPFGTIGVTYSKVLKHLKGVDRKESFRINIGTEF